MLRSLAVALTFLGSLVLPAAAQQPLRSECLAMANAPPRAIPVSLQRVAAKPQEVAITYVGHSTYYLDTPEGVRIGTDFNGVYRTGRLPDVVTMNRAHSTHYTLFPDPKITHVLHGWGEEQSPTESFTRPFKVRAVPERGTASTTSSASSRPPCTSTRTTDSTSQASPRWFARRCARPLRRG